MILQLPYLDDFTGGGVWYFLIAAIIYYIILRRKTPRTPKAEKFDNLAKEIDDILGKYKLEDEKNSPD